MNLFYIYSCKREHILTNKGKNLFKILKVTENSENHHHQQQVIVPNKVENVQDFNQLNFSLERVEDQQQQQQQEQREQQVQQQQDQVEIEMSGEPTLDQLTTSNAVITTNINENNNKDDLALLDGDGLDGDGSSPQHHLGDIDDPNDTSLKDIDDTLDFANVSHQQGDGKYLK